MVKKEESVTRNIELFNLIYRLSIIPRWGDFTPRYEDTSASHSYRVAVIAMMIALEENAKYNRNLDMQKIIGRAIFHDFNEAITGPIKHCAKKNPIVGDVIKELEEEAAKEIASRFDEPYHSYLYDYIVNGEDDTPEGRVVDIADTFDALLFSSREIQSLNHFHFPKVYEDSKRYLVKSEFQSVRDMLFEFERIDSRYRKFLMSVLEMSRIKRWSDKLNTYPDNDATHTFRAAAMGMFFALYESTEKGIEVDIPRLLGKILLHDLPETITGDMKGTVKHQNEKIKKAFEKYEQAAAQEILEWTPSVLQEQLADYILDPKDKTTEGLLVDVVDKIDALVKSHIELYRNTTEYQKTYDYQRSNLLKKYPEEPSVQYFYEEILDHLDIANQ